MDRYLILSAFAITLAAFIPAIIFLFRSMKNFLLMINEFKSGKHDMAANLVPFAAPFMSKLYSKRGNLYRIAFLKNIFLFICCFAFIAIMYYALGIKN